MLYTGILSAIHILPYPVTGLGAAACILIPSGLAPRLKYAFSFSPYIYLSLPITIPHCISRAAPPVTNGTAYEVPVTLTISVSYAVCFLIFISTPGASISGFIPASM